jgi:hypothetical protein
MKNAIRGILVASAMAGALVVHAQTTATPAAATPTAEEIVSKHLAAIGGKEAIAKVKSMSMENTLQVMGNEAPNTILLVDGVGYKSETEFNGTKIIQCVNDKGGWQVNPMAGATDPTPMADDEYKSQRDQIFVGGQLLNYAEKGTKVEVSAKDTATYTLKVTPKEGTESTYVIDAKTYYIKSYQRKGKMQGQDVDVTTTFSDYRKTDGGFVIPYSMDIDLGGQFSMSIVVKKVDMNKQIDPAIFAIPKSTT